jgi:hypothetical protein
VALNANVFVSGLLKSHPVYDKTHASSVEFSSLYG